MYGPPLVRPFPSPGPLRAVEGRDFVVHCPVGGYPIQRVSWTKGEWIMCVLTIFCVEEKIGKEKAGSLLAKGSEFVLKTCLLQAYVELGSVLKIMSSLLLLGELYEESSRGEREREGGREKRMI